MKKLSLKKMQNVQGGIIDPSCRFMIDYLLAGSENEQAQAAWMMTNSTLYTC